MDLKSSVNHNVVSGAVALVRTHEDVRDEVARIIDYFLDKIYSEHERISGRTYDGVHAPFWVKSCREAVEEITKELKEFESSELVTLYLSRATDGGSGFRNNLSTIYHSLDEFRGQVVAADGISEQEPTYTPGARTETSEGDVPVLREFSGFLFGRRSEFLGTIHQKTVRTFKSCRPTTIQVYDRDCYGRRYWK